MDKEAFLREVKVRAGLPDTNEAEKATRAVLLALTDVLSSDEAHDMASQLPKELKGIVTGRLAQAGRVQKMSWDQLVERVQRELELSTREDAERVINGVFATLKRAVSPGEMEDVEATLPTELREHLQAV